MPATDAGASSMSELSEVSLERSLRVPQKKDDAAIYREANDLNSRAEVFLKRAAVLNRQGQAFTEIARLMRRALKLEIQAISLVEDRKHLEPARSQLFYNAAKIAWGLQDFDAAERFCCGGLAGDPAPEMGTKLQALRRELVKIRMSSPLAAAKGRVLN